MPDREDYTKAFDFISDVRKFEIGLFWQRSIFFWGFITTTTLAFGAAYQTHNRNLQFAAAVIGVVSAVVWTLVNRSSLYWQRHWELELDEIQRQAISLAIYGDEANKRIVVKQGWGWRPKHFSLSKLLIAFSDFVLLVWLGLAFACSPLWPLLKASGWLDGVMNSQDFPAMVVAALGAGFIWLILRCARPSHISPQSN